MKTYSFLLACMFLVLVLNAQETSFETWGKGLLLDPQQDEEGAYGRLPETLAGIILFDEAGGMPIGKIMGETGLQLSCEQQSIQIQPSDLKEYGYEISGLLYWEEENGYIQIFRNSIPGGVWIRQVELAQHQWTAESWMEFITAGKVILYPERLGIKMNLRETPKASGKLLVTMTDDHFQITPTGRTQGLWAEVEVVKYTGAYCSGESGVSDSWTGWVKLLDDQGHPNLWTYTRGC